MTDALDIEPVRAALARLGLETADSSHTVSAGAS